MCDAVYMAPIKNSKIHSNGRRKRWDQIRIVPPPLSILDDLKNL